MSVPPLRAREKGCGDVSEHVRASYERGLALLREQAFFEAHEALEEAWRAAAPEERDFFQGLVHVAVAWYQAGRGNRVGCERQLEKAQRRLSPFRQVHRGLDVGRLLEQVAAASGRFPHLPPLELVRATRGRACRGPG
jgi:predicted metal-dependent hydrolase